MSGTTVISRESFDTLQEPESRGLSAGRFYNIKERNGSTTHAFTADGDGAIYFDTADERKAECG